MATVRTRKRGKTWSYAFETGKAPDGKRQITERGGFTTKEEAYTAGIEAYNEWRHGFACTDLSKITVNELMAKWLEYIQPQIKEQSMRIYRAMIKNNTGSLGDLYLKDVTPEQCDAWLRKLAGSGISAGYLKKIRTLFAEAFGYAVYPCRLIVASPLDHVPVPKIQDEGKVQRTIITREKLEDIISAHPKDRIPLLVAWHTGMRISEVLGLTWDNVDLENRVIHVRTQLVQIIGKGKKLTDKLKTPRSRRDIPIDSTLADVLEEWKLDQELDSELEGDARVVYYTDPDSFIVKTSARFLPPDAEPVPFVCTSADGRIRHHTQLTSMMAKEGLNMHSLRHTHATALLEAGAPLKGISARLGHSGIGITNGLYIHDTEEIRNTTRDLFEGALNADKKADADKM